MDGLQSEDARLHALKQLKLLDTPPSESFDRITRMASKLFDLPIAAVSLTDRDRQWFKSRVGVEHWEIPRESAPCGEVAATASTLVLPDLLDHPCYRDSLLARSGIRFYAGAPLTTRDGFCLGAMCVLGTEPRKVTDSEVATLTDLAAMVMAQIELQHAFGRLDPVSGLPNRNQFLEDLQDQARDQAGEGRYLIHVELLDAMRMADAVRVLGARVIDDLMRQVSRELTRVLGSVTQLYQVGPTHLAWIVAPSKKRSLDRGLDLLRRRVARFVAASTLPALAQPAIGIAPFRLGQVEGEDALRMAHNAAQDARESGQAVSTYSAKADDDHQRRFRLLSDMKAALAADDQLSLVYQPKVDVRSGQCVGAEALLRWNHPVLGAISPGEFVPVVEHTELSGPMTHWVTSAALKQIKAWQRLGIDLPVAVNVSAPDLEDPNFAPGLIAQLAAADLSPRVLEIEVTESAVVMNRSRVASHLQQLRAAGFRVAIDDFGTGYSSLSYLKSLPADVVKIDQSFIRELAKDEKGRTLVQMMIEMSNLLGFRVVAEGVEDEASYKTLAFWQCDEAQGYWISRPLTPEAFQAWVTGRNIKARAAA